MSSKDNEALNRGRRCRGCRLNVLWALIGDHRTFEPTTPPPAGSPS